MNNEYFTTIHTDGGAAPNPGEGAYVAILKYGERTACVRGYAPYATNQQMELAAAIAGLSALKSTKIPVTVITDSQYLQSGASMWIKGWRKNGWKNTEGKPLKNLDLWQELDAVMSRFVVSFWKVDGHAGVEFNVKADSLVWDTRDAQGDPTLYRVTDISEIPSTWNFTSFEAKIKQTVRPEVDYLRQRFAAIQGPQ